MIGNHLPSCPKKHPPPTSCHLPGVISRSWSVYSFLGFSQWERNIPYQDPPHLPSPKHTHTQTHTSPLSSRPVSPCTVSSLLLMVEREENQVQIQEKLWTVQITWQRRRQGHLQGERDGTCSENHVHGQKYSPHSRISLCAVSVLQCLLGALSKGDWADVDTFCQDWFIAL